MPTSLTFHNLMYNKWRTALSTSGVTVAIVLIFMQLGFLNAVATTATLIYDHLVFDVMLRSPDYFHFCDPREFPSSYLPRVASLPGVESARRLHVTLANWRIPENQSTRQGNRVGELRGVLAMGIDPAARVFDLPDIARQAATLRSPYNLLVDRRTNGEDYGAVNGEVFGQNDIGAEVEISDAAFRIAGCFELGAGLAANGSVVVGSTGYSRLFPGDTEKNVNYGLIILEPGVDVDRFCGRLRERLSRDTPAGSDSQAAAAPVSVLTREQVRRYEQRRWLIGTPIGAIFLIGVAVALMVGVVVVYMVLSNDVARHIREYATLKAMGYRDRYLNGVVMQQAVAIAILGYVVSLICAEVLYRLVGHVAHLPMEMNWWIRVLVLVLSVVMCCSSGLATLRKLRAADPADLF
jgi:putative ABC transport system permease protein